MITQCIQRATTLALSMVLVPVVLVHANEWNERTVLTFTEPVMIPGATLQPGSYVFRLADSSSARHIVQVLTNDGSKMVATAQAVPLKRPEATGDIVLKFNPTDKGTPPAIKAWFYPGSTYGHEFVYAEQEAKHIAERTKTVVLSVDIPGSDLEKGTLYTYNSTGQRAPWRGEDATTREWDAWQRSRATRSSAPIVRGDFQGTRVELDELESNTHKYIGQTISVDAEVEEVYGPRLFTIDEANWGDLDGEILVFAPSPLAALVGDDDRVTITGKVQRFVRAEVEREWGWFGAEPEIEAEFSRKPVLVASRIVGGDNNTAMVIRVGDSDRPVGTSGNTAASAPSVLTDLAAIADGNDELVGRHVRLSGLNVAATPAGGGFFARAGDQLVFVLAAKSTAPEVRTGDTVSVTGVVLEMPDSMDDRLKPPSDSNDEIYVYATDVTK